MRQDLSWKQLDLLKKESSWCQIQESSIFVQLHENGGLSYIDNSFEFILAYINSKTPIWVRNREVINFTKNQSNCGKYIRRKILSKILVTESPGGDSSSHKYKVSAALKVVERFFTFALLAVAVDGWRQHLLLRQHGRDEVCVALRLHKH